MVESFIDGMAGADVDAGNRIVRLRQLLLVAFFAGVAGTAAELLLLGHVEGWQQWVPLVLLVAAIPSLAWQVFRPARPARLTFLTLMGLFMVSGALGVGLHYQGNVEFELEMYPGMSGMELFAATMTGATPVLAPGTMVLLGLVGLAYAHVSTFTPNHSAKPEEAMK